VPKPVIEIDGSKIEMLDDFYRQISRFLMGKAMPVLSNLDAFNDALRGGLGGLNPPYVIRWLYSERSRIALGTTRPDGQTVFEVLIEIIQSHGEGGQEDDGIDLELV
jgi:hypothetical protein